MGYEVIANIYPRAGKEDAVRIYLIPFTSLHPHSFAFAFAFPFPLSSPSPLSPKIHTPRVPRKRKTN